jgi:hypothetical protein
MKITPGVVWNPLDFKPKVMGTSGNSGDEKLKNN